MSSEKNNDAVKWIVAGAVAILIAGMVTITAASIFSRDATATVAALGGMIATALAGLFGLHQVAETQKKLTEQQTEATREMATSVDTMSRRLNGELDARIQAAVATGISEFRAAFLVEVRATIAEVLDEWNASKSSETR